MRRWCPVRRSGRRLETWSRAATDWTGSSWAFGVAALVIVVWLVTGPLFHFSDTWQLVINTGTTVVTFLMVFLIQRTQNKDALAVHLKLNELVAAIHGASNRLIDVEDLSEADLAKLHRYYPAPGPDGQARHRPREVALVEEAEALHRRKRNAKPPTSQT
jgi:low affinity Fe/Cu permease